VSTDKTSYIVGEPVIFQFSLKNKTKQVINGYFPLGFASNKPEVWYRKDNGEFVQFISNDVAAGMRYERILAPGELGPGESKSKIARLLYAIEPAGLVLKEPGEYEFQMKYYFEPFPVASPILLTAPTIRVRVHEVAPEEKEVFKQWNDPELLDFIQGNVSFVSDEKVQAGMVKAVNFMERYNNSYTTTAKNALLEYLEKRGVRRNEFEKEIYQRLKIE
jgi:hypothetical protein